MDILFYCLGAAALVLTGAIVSGGLRLPARHTGSTDCTTDAADDLLSRDLAALLAYGREEDNDAV